MKNSPYLDRPCRLLRAGDCARYLGVSRAWLYAHRAALEAQGFPAPVAGLGLLLWDKVAIDRWLDGRLPPALAGTAADLPTWRDELARNADRIAAGFPARTSS